MKYLLIVDLMGTLLEARQLTNGLFDPNDDSLNRLHTRHKNVEQEYFPRIAYVARKLNKIIENGIKVSIVTSIDHCTEYQLISAINNIDMMIKDDNKNQIEYYIDDPFDYVTETLNDRTFITNKREKAYDMIINKNKGYYYITIDDIVNASCVSKVLDLGGQFIHINNMINSIGWITSEDYEDTIKKSHMNDSIDRLVKFYELCSTQYLDFEDCNKECIFSKEETYLKLLSNDLDIEKLYSWVELTDMKREFNRESGYSFDYTQELIDHKCIQIYPSFEQAYQKTLVPKFQDKRF